MPKLPIKAAKDLATTYQLDQVIVVAWSRKENNMLVTTFGKTETDCDQASQGGNLIKKTLGFPDQLCVQEPNRVTKLKARIKELEALLQSKS